MKKINYSTPKSKIKTHFTNKYKKHHIPQKLFDKPGAAVSCSIAAVRCTTLKQRGTDPQRFNVSPCWGSVPRHVNTLK
jgi:hypothetical protein